MPECRTCKGAGTVFKMPDGRLIPFYDDPKNSIGDKIICSVCDGWGREGLPKPPAQK